MIVSHEHKFIFLKTRKTAGTSIETFLARMLGPGEIVTPVNPPVEGHEPRNFGPPKWVPWAPITWRALLARSLLTDRRWFYNHMPAHVARERLGRRVWGSYFKFCFERDPWDKTLSWYYFRTRGATRPIDFPRFVRTRALPVDWELYSIRDSIAVDFVGRFEDLGADLREALRQVGLGVEVDLPFEKSGLRPRDAGVARLYDAETAALVGTAFRREVEAFGYDPPQIGRLD